MSPKPSNNMQSDRPESGGTDHNDEREKTGLLERDKEKFAAEGAEKARSSKKRASSEAAKSEPKPSANPATRKKR